MFGVTFIVYLYTINIIVVAKNMKLKSKGISTCILT